MHSLVLLLGLVAAAAALPAMPDPSDLALMLSEEDFEDYLDEWLEKEEPKWVNLTLADEGRDARSG